MPTSRQIPHSYVLYALSQRAGVYREVGDDWATFRSPGPMSSRLGAWVMRMNRHALGGPEAPPLCGRPAHPNRRDDVSTMGL